MKLSFQIYIILGFVFILSFLSAWLLPTSEFFKGLFATPGIIALVGVVFQLIRDSAQFEKNKFLQKDQQIFNLGATSHIAKVAFDKHVEFCEKYMANVHVAVETLFSEGSTENAIKHSKSLFNLNKEYAAWVPNKISLNLQPFEKALRKMGALEHLADALAGKENAEKRSEAIKESYKLFEDLMGSQDIDSKDPENLSDIAVENIKEKIRSILGINELTEIRRFIIDRSVEFMEKYPNNKSSNNPSS